VARPTHARRQPEDAAMQQQPERADGGGGSTVLLDGRPRGSPHRRSGESAWLGREAAEERGGEERAMNGKGAVDEDEFVDTLGGEVHEPARELGAVRVNNLHEAAGEADEGEGAQVRAEDGIDRGAAGSWCRRARMRRSARGEPSARKAPRCGPHPWRGGARRRG
jgi:hypothetical protein